MALDIDAGEGWGGFALIDVYARVRETFIKDNPPQPSPEPASSGSIASSITAVAVAPADALQGLTATEKEVLGALDSFGPLDSRALSLVVPGLPHAIARVTVNRLVVRGLVVFEWAPDRRRPWFALAPALRRVGREAP